jgi:transmembrane sensor
MKGTEGILQTAADWFDRLRHEDLSQEELASWQRWISEDAAHQRAFDRLQDAWQRFEGVPAPALPTRAQLEADAYTGDVAVSEWRRQPERSTRSRRAWKPLAAAAAVSLVAVGAFVLRNPSPLAPPAVTAFETQVGEHRKVQLTDGSMVVVGAKSLVWVRFQDDLRELVLDRGEAYFQVEKDPRRPFVVRAGDASVTAIGTAFNVSKTGPRVRVVVTDGVVSVTPHTAEPVVRAGAPKRKAIRLSAGSQWTTEASSGTANVNGVAPATATSWRKGRLEYISEPLKYVVADVNRYADLEIVIADAGLGELSVTGTIFEDDIDGWLQSIGEFIPVDVERAEPGRVVLHSR